MAVKLVNETWKKRPKKRGDPDHSRLWARLNKHDRTMHMFTCKMCLNAAIEAVYKFKSKADEMTQEFTQHGTIGGRVYSHDSKPWRVLDGYARFSGRPGAPRW